MIPKIIHQVWLGNKPIPKQFKKWRAGIISKHPSKDGWKHYLWTDENIKGFGAEKLLEECESLAAQSDVIRLLAVEKYGGIYLDMDIECIKPLTPLINVPCFAAKEDEKNICNAVFGSVPHHRWLLNQIHQLPTKVYKPTTWGVKLMSGNTDGLTLYPKEFFYPFLWDMPKKFQKKTKNTYLVHHWNKSWC